MKVAIALILGFIGMTYAEYTARTAEDLATFRTKCSTALNIPAEKVEGFKQWKFDDDQVTKDYILCVFKEFPIYEEGKGIIKENLVDQLAAGSDKTKEDLLVEVNKCVDDRKADENEAAYCFRQFACFKQNHLQLIRASVKKD